MSTMNEQYNRDIAANILDRALQVGDSKCLTRLFETVNVANCLDIEVSEIERPRSFVISRKDNTGSDPPFQNSNIITFKGVLESKSLPPFNVNDLPRNQSKLRYKRQAAAISGLNIPAFEDGIRNLAVLHDILARHFPEGQLEPWVPKVSGGCMLFEASNRLFTPTYDVSAGAAIDFPAEWGISKRFRHAGGDKFKFTEDNFVAYNIKKVEDKTESFHQVSPARFRVGDIVQMDFWVTAVQVGREKYRMLVKLKGLTLIDDSCSKLASLSRIQQQMSLAKVSGPIKRSSSEIEDGDGEELTRVSRMRIDA